MLQCKYRDCGDGTVFHDPRRCGTCQIGGSCRECTLLRDDTLSKVQGWISRNTKIGPAVEVAVGHHRGLYGIEIMINSSFGDGTRSWVMIVNGINKYVTEMSEETQENRAGGIGDSTGQPIAEARPKQTSRPTSFSPTITLPYLQRQWIDVEPGKFDRNSIGVSRR